MADPTFINLLLDQDGTSNPLAPIGWVSASTSTANEHAGFGPVQSIRGEDSFEEAWTNVPASAGAAVVSAVGPFNIPDNSTISFSVNNTIAQVSVFAAGDFVDNTKATASEVKTVIEALTALSVDVVGERILVKPPVFGQSIQLVGISTAAEALGMSTNPSTLLSLNADHAPTVFESSQTPGIEDFNFGDLLLTLSNFSEAEFSTTLLDVDSFEVEHNHTGYSSSLSLPTVIFSGVSEGDVITVMASTNDITEEFTYNAPALVTDALTAASFASFFSNSTLYSAAVTALSPDRLVLTPASGNPITLTVTSEGLGTTFVGAENVLINSDASLYNGGLFETFVPGWLNEQASDPDEFITNFTDWALHVDSATFNPTHTYTATIKIELNGLEVEKTFTVVNPASEVVLATQMAAAINADVDLVSIFSGQRVLWGTVVSSNIVLDVITNHVSLIAGADNHILTLAVPHNTVLVQSTFTNDGVNLSTFTIETFERDPVSAASQGPNVDYQIAIDVDVSAIGLYKITVNNATFAYNATGIQSLSFLATQLRNQINLQGHLVDIEAAPLDPLNPTLVGIRSTSTPITPIADIAIVVEAPSDGLVIQDPELLQQINWTWNSQLTTI